MQVDEPASKNPVSLAAPYMAAHTKKPITDKPLEKWFVRLLVSGRQTRTLFSAELSYVLLSRRVNIFFCFFIVRKRPIMRLPILKNF